MVAELSKFMYIFTPLFAEATCIYLPEPTSRQVGLNGVDNGSLRFTGVRIPRGNLLDRFGQVDRNGQYSSPFPMSRRFAATLGELTGGRVGLTCASVGILKVRPKIALTVILPCLCDLKLLAFPCKWTRANQKLGEINP